MLPLLFSKHLANSFCLQLGSKCRELKDIHFGQCYKISDEGMIVIAKGCLKLQRIYMQENKLVSTYIIFVFFILFLTFEFLRTQLINFLLLAIFGCLRQILPKSKICLKTMIFQIDPLTVQVLQVGTCMTIDHSGILEKLKFSRQT